ncbi:MAG TPA: DNA alkylation repair protein [Acidimicrobiia bacterium]|nr:DNA alkylation repair protein [Acidimicrobiia bacterium]
MEGTGSLVRFVQAELAALADPAKAAPMQAYMKTSMPFYGVPKPARVPIAKELRHRFPPANTRQYRQNVLALWSLTHREEKYLAIGYARGFPAFVDFRQIDLFERLIVEGAWWDLVDEVASPIVSRVVLIERQQMRPLLEGWIESPVMWLRRAAILCHNGHKDATDWLQLSDFCLRRAQESEFFIRKAIGWALREYARTNPEAVRTFLQRHGDQLSGLSYREAAKHLSSGR